MTLPGFESPTPSAARELQREWAARLVFEPLNEPIDTVCGVDVSGVRDGTAVAAAVLLTLPDLNVAEFATAEAELTFPYRSGLLSFRECPVVVQAVERLSRPPDVIMVDGQGTAHPRRLGLACHLGLLLDIPTLGCAKSRLCGTYDEPGNERGCCSPLIEKRELVGRVVRTRTGVKPVFVSPGHRTTLDDAVRLVLACGKGVRLPEPTRQAHRLAGSPRS